MHVVQNLEWSRAYKQFEVCQRLYLRTRLPENHGIVGEKCQAT